MMRERAQPIEPRQCPEGGSGLAVLQVGERHFGTQRRSSSGDPGDGQGLIMSLVGPSLLHAVVGDSLDLLETSAVVFEKNGDVSLATFTSEWCRCLEAAPGEPGHCRECRWTQGSRVAMETGAPVDLECAGGIRLYAVPIRAGDEAVGAMNVGYGDPPRDDARLDALSTRFCVSVEELRRSAAAYASRPPFIIEVAKRRLRTSAQLLGGTIAAKIGERREAERARADRGRLIEAQVTLAACARQLTALHRLDQAILLAVESPEPAAKLALELVRQLLPCEQASVGVFIWPGSLAPQPMRMKLFSSGPTEGSPTEEPLPADVLARLDALHRGETDVVEDAAITPALARPFLTGHVGASIALPLRSRNTLIGVLALGWGAPRRLSQEEVDFASQVATRLAIAIEQAGLRSATTTYARELEHRVAQRTAQLREANQELEAFSYSVSHDLRAPLRAINGFTSALVEDCEPRLDAEGRRLVSIIRENAGKMNQLIDDLLAFSRLSRAELTHSRLDMRGMAKAQFFELTTEATRARIDLELSPMPDALGDPSLMKQVWANLLDNAIKFSSKRPRARIEVSGEARPGELVYQVKDNGAGFDMRYVEKLFGVFQRLHASRDFEGSGVGLALVQRIIRRHGGRAWATGETNLGATFFFALPEKGASEHGHDESHGSSPG